MRVSGAMTMRLGRSRSPMRIGVKRGWTDMTTLLDKGSSGDDDFADLLARLNEATGVSSVSQLTNSNSWDMQTCQAVLLAYGRARLRVTRSVPMPEKAIRPIPKQGKFRRALAA